MKNIFSYCIISFAFFSSLFAEIVPSLEEESAEKTVYTVRPIQSDMKHPEKVSVKLGPGVVLQGHFLKMYNRFSSYLEISLETPDNFVQGQKVELYMNHLSSMINGKPGGSPINIRINGKLFLTNYDPNSGSLISNTFNVTEWIGEGQNTIRIEMQGGKSAYWLTNLRVNFLHNE